MLSKILISGLLITTFSVTTSIAQHRNHKMENKSPEEATEMATKQMTKKLNLTDAQVVLVRDILLETFTKQNTIKEQHPQLDEVKQQIKEIRENSKEKVNSVLTQEQIGKLKSDKKERTHFIKGKENNRSIDNRVQKMKVKLDLTDKQVSELTSIFTESKKDIEKVKAQYSELEDVKKEMKLVRKESKEQLKKVLTEEQIKLLKEFHTDKKGKKK